MIAYRAWDVQPSGQLKSLGTPHQWNAGLNKAFHYPFWTSTLDPRNPATMLSHRAPMEDCRCGIWVLATLEAVHEYIDSISVPYSRTQFVFGAVQTYGLHIEHEFGIRCEKAQIVTLFMDRRRESLIRRASQIYDVPVEVEV